MDEIIAMSRLGTIRTPHKQIAGMPIQPSGAEGIKGSVEVNDQYQSGLRDLDGFSHIILLYIFHEIKQYDLQVIPFMDIVPRGIFSTRSPKRPNRIGMSIVKLISVHNNKVYFEGADMLDQTPLLDIKPFFGDFDNRLQVKCGWLDEVGGLGLAGTKSDGRFVPID